MRSLLLSGDTDIAQYLLEEDGTFQQVRKLSIPRATFSIPRENGVFTINEGRYSGSFLWLDRELNVVDQVDFPGQNLCHIYYLPEKKKMYGSCYHCGRLTTVEADDNGLGALCSDFIVGKDAPGTPRAHCSIPTPDKRFLLTAAIDQDRLYCWNIEEDGIPRTNEAAPYCELPKGSGPRHLRFHPNGKTLYVVTEYSNEILILDYQAENGSLTLRQTVSTLPEGFSGESFGSALLITRDGKRLYAANRGADTVVLFAIAEDCSLTQLAQFPCGGHWPRHMEFSEDESLLMVANDRSDNVTVHRVDAATGALSVLTQIPFVCPGYASEWIQKP